jgi:uncharacterized protein (TIGR03000 family)
VRRIGGQIVNLVIRPLEAIAAEQALLQAYYDYFGSVADYNRSQFQLYRALGNPAQALPMLDQILKDAKSPANPVTTPLAPNAPPVGAAGVFNPASVAAGSNVSTNPADSATAFVHVRVPPEAEVFCDNIRLNLTGMERNFITPPLPRGRTFPYEIRIRWNGPDGKAVEVVRSIQVETGRHCIVDVFENIKK